MWRSFAAAVVRLRGLGRERMAIASLVPGRAVVHGTVSGLAELSAPVSGRTGIGFRVLIEQEQGVRGWVAVVDLAEFADFEVSDPSGAIHVRASSSTIDLNVGVRGGDGGPFRPLPAAVVELLSSRVAVHGVLFHKGFRWREWVLVPGQDVRIRGQAVRVPSDDPIGYRRLAQALVLGGGQQPLEIS